MTKKEIRQKYCDKRNYTSWNKYNITEYSKWLENELIKTQKKVKKLTLTDVVVAKRTLCDCEGFCDELTPKGQKRLICKFNLEK